MRIFAVTDTFFICMHKAHCVILHTLQTVFYKLSIVVTEECNWHAYLHSIVVAKVYSIPIFTLIPFRTFKVIGPVGQQLGGLAIPWNWTPYWVSQYICTKLRYCTIFYGFVWRDHELPVFQQQQITLTELLIEVFLYFPLKNFEPHLN